MSHESTDEGEGSSSKIQQRPGRRKTVSYNMDGNDGGF